MKQSIECSKMCASGDYGRPFGGITKLFARNFRQCLPVCYKLQDRRIRHLGSGAVSLFRPRIRLRFGGVNAPNSHHAGLSPQIPSDLLKHLKAN
jgi:hypothetical protein